MRGCRATQVRVVTSGQSCPPRSERSPKIRTASPGQSCPPRSELPPHPHQNSLGQSCSPRSERPPQVRTAPLGQKGPPRSELSTPGQSCPPTQVRTAPPGQNCPRSTYRMWPSLLWISMVGTEEQMESEKMGGKSDRPASGPSHGFGSLVPAGSLPGLLRLLDTVCLARPASSGDSLRGVGIPCPSCSTNPVVVHPAVTI